MRKWFAGLVLLVGLGGIPAAVEADAGPPVLVEDSAQNPAVLKQFRTTSDPLPKSNDNRGLSDLHASGSAEFCSGNLGLLQQKLAGHEVWVLDLRQESHGFLNGLPVSWFAEHNWANLGDDPATVAHKEDAELKGLASGQIVNLPLLADVEAGQAAGTSTTVATVQSEQELLAPTGFHYLRLPVPDHRRPDDATVDRFITFARQLPPGAWIHFHCAGGMGRTTTFMAMFDMMRNARHVSFNAIVERQKVLGGEDLVALPAPDNYKYEPKLKRLDFLNHFYQYCRDNHDAYKTPWTAWLSTATPQGDESDRR